MKLNALSFTLATALCMASLSIPTVAQGNLLLAARVKRQSRTSEAVSPARRLPDPNNNQRQGTPQQTRPTSTNQPQQPAGQTKASSTAGKISLKDYPDNVPLTQMTPELLESFLASEEDVILLTRCFENFKTCRYTHAINLIKQLQELGIGGRCKGCTPKEQDHLDNMIYQFIQKFITRYPRYWRSIVPNIGRFLVPRSS
ncbi:uncharacterized protein LOC108668556 [Hyalella azteca]|uniref:Uncharacterized protein LOC108668556 n=1 Tax=Hyalella azteca TaxID=294128 RepID=A0A8B7NCG6_HYAAZ|nr:uncharacterized protein LOC108668556 [Hyalella azteca]